MSDKLVWYCSRICRKNQFTNDGQHCSHDSTQFRQSERTCPRHLGQYWCQESWQSEESTSSILSILAHIRTDSLPLVSKTPEFSSIRGGHAQYWPGGDFGRRICSQFSRQPFVTSPKLALREYRRIREGARRRSSEIDGIRLDGWILKDLSRTERQPSRSDWGLQVPGREMVSDLK
jgi:hypothetical protein